jgi:predicted ArsR family transcriptional regulator
MHGPVVSDGRGRAAVLERLKRGGPASAAELAGALHISDVAVRQHLHGLAEDGAVSYVDEAHGRGRPLRRWALTGDGHRRFADAHAELSVGLLDAARAALGEGAVQRLLDHRMRDTVARYRARIPDDAKLCRKVRILAELRSAEGYMAESRREGPGRYLLIENHCPIGDAAAHCAGLCGSEQTVFEAVLGPEVTVTRIEHRAQGGRRCAFQVAARG